MDRPQDPPADSPDPQAAAIVASLEKVLGDAIAKVEPSVVAIHREKNESGQETLAVRGRRRPRAVPMGFPGRDIAMAEAQDMISFDNGSGVVIGDQGEILTLFHVVRGAQRLLVRAPGIRWFEAEIIAADPRSDLAVIVPVGTDGSELPKLKPIVIGDATRLRKGAFLLALATSFNAGRDGSASASWGILSNVARRLDFDREESVGPAPKTTLGLMHFPTLLQLDAKLNLGMSGGVVVNLKGELVGLTTMASSPTGFDALAGYAVPMDRIVRRAIATLKEGKEVEYGLLGLRADEKLEPGGRAHRQLACHARAASVQRPDHRGQRHSSHDFPSLVLAVNVYSAGDAVRLTIIRDDKTIERTIVLAKLSIDGEVIATNSPSHGGAFASSTPRCCIGRVPIFHPSEPAMTGVVIVEVEEGSPAAAAGLKRGQLISKVGEKRSTRRVSLPRPWPAFRVRSSSIPTWDRSRSNENRRASRSVPRVL